MLNKTLEQTAIGNGIFKQSGRDLIDNSVNITVIPSFDDFFIYEDDIKDNMATFIDTPFPNNSSILIDDKNILNNLSEDYYNSIILKNSLPHFGKIFNFLENPRNSKYVDIYYSITEELQNIVLAIKPTYSSFDLIFNFLYKTIASKCTADKQFMKNRTKVLLFLHFMYYNCDIGLKNK